MCGIVGEFRRKSDVTREQIYNMASALLHRGPDESGIFISPDRKWGVGHRRLSINDIECGKQPIHDSARKLTLVYNGELYDYDNDRDELVKDGIAFRSHSDSEVLLMLYAKYGMDFLPKLRGEFAFCIVDENKREAILVRDRIGLKPLFFHQSPDGLYFASEIKALFQVPQIARRISPAGLLAALSMADLPGETVFEGIQQVQHAHYLRIKLDTLEVTQHQYWDAFRDRRTDLPKSPQEQTELVRAEVDKAVKIRLRADVPVGTFLSGGIDSSLVSGVAARTVDNIHAFSLSFEDSPRHDEFHYAKAVAEMHPNINLHRIPLRHDEVVLKIPQTVWHLERPFGNLHSVAKIISSQYARNYVRCVLTGDGGDESFCGYSTYWLQDVLQRANYSFVAIQGDLASMKSEAKKIGGNRFYLSGGLAGNKRPNIQYLFEKLGFPPCDLATSLDTESRLRRLLSTDLLAQVKQSPAHRLADHLSKHMPQVNGHSHAMLLQYVQLNCTVPEYISIIADRSEWAGSVEGRSPLFDYKVVELAMGLPIEMKIKGDREKHILREAYRDILPTAVTERRKQAFLAPPSPFRTTAAKALLEEHLSPAAIKRAGIWNPTRIRLLRTARRFFPNNRILNIILTVILTSQILHSQYIEGKRFSQ